MSMHKMAAKPCRLIVIISMFLFLSLTDQAHASQDNFAEELFIKPLPSGHIYSHFQFTTTWNVDIQDQSAFSHYNLFPKSLGQIISKYSVRELHLSLTQGYWRPEKWGYPIVSAPPGAELWVWFHQNTQDIEQSWKELVNALSGLFCASLNFIDNTVTISPHLAFRPHGISSDNYASNSSYLKYATLPRENVCTENLTPWKKLLPCDSRAGISTLFSAIQLYNANYHSLAIHLRPICQDPSCSSPAVELSQSMSVVFDPPIRELSKQDWSLRKLFGRGLKGPCPLASISNVYVDITDNSTSNPVQLTPDPDSIIRTYRGGAERHYALYDLKTWNSPHQLMVSMKWNQKHQYVDINRPQIHIHRFITGYGQEKGGITCLLYNNDAKNFQTVVYLETVPWYIRLHFHTLKIRSYNRDLRPDWVKYIPGQDRSKAYMLEMVMTLPPSSVTTVSIEFDRAFLKWTEHPPDANIGFHISSAVVSTVLKHGENYTSPEQSDSRLEPSLTNPSNQKEFFIRLYSEILLIQLPTPDFSMPYNVICLACTVVAIAFGSLHNLTTRNFAPLDPSEKRGLKARLSMLFGKFRKSSKKAATDESEIKQEKEEKPLVNDQDSDTKDSESEKDSEGDR
ncbi:GPI transamidase component PIG-T-like [Ptychodera flava]|uniref:GPI transamidase component PIG-T-like n=1 Tax=Ptychodera flava TaxID=63121 RepID=UPI003969D4B0